MAQLEHINSALKKVAGFLEPLLPIVGCHMVEFLTMNHWDNLLPPRLQQNLLNIPQDQLQYMPSATVDLVPSGNEDDLEPWSLASCDLSSFQRAVKEHSLPALGVTSTVEQVMSEACAKVMDPVTMKGVMSEKKSHEVEIMSHVVAQLARGCGIDWIVDVGSGRGYLSSSLVLQYGMNVVAIDSSKTNTASGLIRNNRIQRHWTNLKQAEQDRKDGKYIKKGKRRKAKKIPIQDLESVSHCLELNTQQQSSKAPNQSGRYIGVTRFVTEDMDLAGIVGSVVDSGKELKEVCNRDINSDAKLDGSSLGDVGSKICSNASGDNSSVDSNTTVNKVEVTGNSNVQFPQSKVDLTDMDTFHSDNDVEDCTHSIPVSTHASSVNNQVPPGTKNVSSVTTAVKSVNTQVTPVSAHACPVKHDEKPNHMNLALVGLHTCGNLAASSARLFLANPAVSLLCNVGCCYHLIEEEYSVNTYTYRKIPVSSLPCKSPSDIDNLGPSTVKSETSKLSCKNECISLPLINTSQSCSCQCRNGVTNQGTYQQPSDSSYVSEKEELEKGWKTAHGKDSHVERKTEPHKQMENVRNDDEDDETLDPLHPSEIPNQSCGFPLSSVLQESKFALGRNTRMLSCQPSDRLTQQSFAKTEALYWRALLQVILLEKLGGDRSSIGHVGRLSAKCTSFTQYAKMAIEKLGLSIQVSEEELNSVLEQYQDARTRLERFFLLRASVAPVIEGLILLDRLAFLKEQDANISCHLVQLFDPVISPRCHALLALRQTKSP